MTTNVACPLLSFGETAWAARSGLKPFAFSSSNQALSWRNGLGGPVGIETSNSWRHHSRNLGGKPPWAARSGFKHHTVAHPANPHFTAHPPGTPATNEN